MDLVKESTTGAANVAVANDQEGGFGRAIADLFKARFPILYVQTWEEDRVLQEIRRVCSSEELIRTPRRVLEWSLTTGLTESGDSLRANTAEPLAALAEVSKIDDAAVFVFKDLHMFLGGRGLAPNPQVIRRLRDLVQTLKASAAPKNLVLTAPVVVLPADLEKDVTVVDFELPSELEIRGRLREIIDANRSTGRIVIDLTDDDEERLVKAALGLTLQEAENAFARAMVHDGRLDVSDVDIVLEEKRQIIQKSGVLEFVRSKTSFEDVGGLQNLKRWLDKRNGAWLDEARRYGLPAPKGVLITGVPGCGKSLTAKCVSSQWGLPLLRLDIGRIFSGLVGSSEENMRAALKSAEAISPSVLWIDEIEKGFSSTSGAGDSGVSGRIFGTFLTWMQEKTKPVFVIATSNTIEGLPPEFLRKGRFDEIFFVDLPTVAERARIIEVHLRARIHDLEVLGELQLSDELFDKLAQSSEGFSGAELEHLVIAGLFDAYSEGRSVRADDFSRAIEQTVPLSVTQADRITAIRQWAEMRAVAAAAREDRGQPAGSPALQAEPRGGRTLDF